MRSHGIRCVAVLLVAGPLTANAAGDLTGDGLVDEADVRRMAAVFMTDDPVADLNGDGTVNFADLALLRSMVPGAMAPATSAGGALPVISITPASGEYALGDTFDATVAADFSADPTIGGTFDIVYDDSVLAVVSVDALGLGDPDFAVEPVLAPGVIQQAGFGDFDGVVGGDAFRIVFEVITPFAARRAPSDVTMRDGGSPGGPFFSAVTFQQQVVDYQGATYELPSIAQYDYAGVVTACSAACDGYTALGGPGGAANAAASYLRGYVRIDADPGSAFSEADVLAFRFELGNDAQPQMAGGDPATDNPYVIDGTQASLVAAGTVGPDGLLMSGQLTLAFTAEPWVADQASLEIDIDAQTFAVAFDSGATAGAAGEGGFVGQPGPARVLVTPDAIDFGTVEAGADVERSTFIRNVGLDVLSIDQVGGIDPLAPPFELDVVFDCSAVDLGPGDACEQRVTFRPVTSGTFSDSFDVSTNDAAASVVIVDVVGEATVVADAVLTITGGIGGLGLCRDLQDDDRVGRFLGGSPVLVCEPGDLGYTTGDFLLLSLFMRKDDTGLPVTGSVEGLSPNGAVCLNLDTGQDVRIPLPAGTTSWDCMAAGLVAAPGEQVLVVVRGASN